VLGRGHPVVPGGGLLPEHLAGVGGEGWARRCGGRTTPAPSPSCWWSSCRGCTPPYARSALRAPSRQRAPRGESSAPTSAAYVAPRVLTDKTRLHLRSASVRTYTFSPRDSQGSCQSAEQGDY
jgi:hypothetical protein